MEHEIPFGNSSRENGTTFLDFPLFLGIFQWNEPTKRVPFTAEPEIPEIWSKWKAPNIYLLSKHTFKKRLATIILSDSLKLFFSGFACPTRVKKAGQRMQTFKLSPRLTIRVENC